MLSRLIVLIMLCSSWAYADQSVVDLSFGSNYSTGATSFDWGLQGDLGSFKQRGLVGVWFDNSGDGRTSSPFITYQVGYDVGESLKLDIFVGPMLLSSPDIILYEPLQLVADLGLGFEKNGNYYGLLYRHIGNELSRGDLSRDFIGVQLRF